MLNQNKGLSANNLLEDWRQSTHSWVVWLENPTSWRILRDRRIHQFRLLLPGKVLRIEKALRRIRELSKMPVEKPRLFGVSQHLSFGAICWFFFLLILFSTFLFNINQGLSFLLICNCCFAFLFLVFLLLFVIFLFLLCNLSLLLFLIFFLSSSLTFSFFSVFPSLPVSSLALSFFSLSFDPSSWVSSGSSVSLLSSLSFLLSVSCLSLHWKQQGLQRVAS